jgi:hypothetical protein
MFFFHFFFGLAMDGYGYGYGWLSLFFAALANGCLILKISEISFLFKKNAEKI